MTTYNTAPYFDDFDENNKFYKILFRPGYAVQARELTQLQSILQNQVKRQGDHLFKDGAMVIPGQMSIDTTIGYVKIQTTTLDVSLFTGTDVVGSSGLTGKVVYAVPAEGSDPATLFVKYTNSGTDTTTKTFAANETLTIDVIKTVTVSSTTPTGKASIATIERGVYYVKGSFVLCEAQTIVLEKYSERPTYRVGLDVIEKQIAPEDDERLLDNAQGSYNYAAPGAHRYFIELVLIKKDVASIEDENFIELLRVELGAIKRHVTTTAYAELEKTLARRTYDESGNYTVRPFTIDVREHRNNNRGAWVGGTSYIIGDVVTSNSKTYVAKRIGTSPVNGTAPNHTSGTSYDGAGDTGVQWEYSEAPVYNRGIFSPTDGGSESKIAVGLEPGKAYVEGYEIEKIATEYVTVDKARDSVQVDNAIIPATVGNYIVVNTVNSVPPVGTLGIVSLYDRFGTTRGNAPASGLIGTARVRFMEWDNGEIGTTPAKYKLGLFDVQLNQGKDFNRDVKSFFSGTINSPLSFTANVVPILNQIVGSVTASASQTILGVGTSFQTDLKIGDLVVFGGNTRRVTAVNNQTSITVDTAASATGAVISYITTNIEEPNNISLVYALPFDAIKTARSSTNTNDIVYTVYQRITGVASGQSLTVTTSSGSFASAAETDNYILICSDTVDGTDGGPAGRIVKPATIIVAGAAVTFTFADAAFANKSFNVIAAINKSGATLTEKTKALVPSTITKTTAAEATAVEVSLGKADCYRLVSVKMATGLFASPGAYTLDISDRYDFDSGQRDTHYGVGKIRLKSSYTPPVAPIQITFEYFDHGSGDYFTVNSYGNYATNTSNTSNIAYENIPLYKGRSLGDSIDFRPRMADDGSGFTNTGAVSASLPKRGIDVRADFAYHLARKTKIAIDFSGNFFSIDGVSSLNPGEPQSPSMGMVLYDLTLQPYTYDTTSESIDVTTYDNKRYTMRDIGKLEKRIDNLEYYTSLSLLEQQTESLNIVDGDGLDRFKNGFVVDGFSGHNTGDINSADYLCSIDMERGELRPFYSMQNVNLMESATSNASRANSNYKLYGDVITLPVIADVPLVKQEYASRIENINPFAIFTFLGNVTINPSSDDWFEVDRRPDIITEVQGNFNTVKTIAENAGVLGTIWNAWQTQWTGASNTTTQSFALRSGARREYTAQVTATQVGQSRSGTRTSVVAKIDRQVVADRVLSTAAIPFTRSRNILIQVKGLKPNTRFYPYFDNVDVKDFSTPASKIIYVPGTGTFDDSTNVGGLTSDETRRINNDTQVCLNRGDVIRGSITGATAVVVGKEYNADTNVYALYVVNIKGTFTAADTLLGNISSATGTFVSVATQAQGSNLVSNLNGDIQLLFNIPNTTSIRFRTGVREFKLVDAVTSDGEFTSRGRGTYRAQGVLETRQATVNAVRNGEIVEEQVADNRVIVQTSERIVADTGWYDPLAQTFMVESPGGAFLSKIDIFFATKDSKIPVNIEIREVVNGFPGKVVLPFSKVSLKPEQVMLSSSTVELDGVSVRKYDTPTTFVFPSPVYVQDRQEYAIVLSSDSNNYKVWISQLGDQIPGSSRTISEQPYMGVFFKSQNASTWTADQMQDLKFTIYRADFDTSVVSNIQFVNSALPYQNLEFDPIETRIGFSKIRIYQRNHGMPAGSRVIVTDSNPIRLTGLVGTGTITTNSTTTVTGAGTNFSGQLVVGSALYNAAGLYVGVVAAIGSTTSLTLTAVPQNAIVAGGFKYRDPIAGIPATEIYTTHVISDVDADSYCVTVLTTALATGYSGGLTMRATRNLQFDSFQPQVQLQTFPDTEVGFGIKATTGKSPDSTTQQAYVTAQSFSDMLANETNILFVPHMVASEVNESISLGGAKSLTMSVAMKSTNSALSPILDTQRTSFIAINNKVNNPSVVNSNVGGLDGNVLISGSSVITVAGNQITTADAGARNILKTATVGKYLTIGGSSDGESTVLTTSVAADGSSITFATNPLAVTGTVTVTQGEIFVDELAPVGSTTFSKYVTKQVTLANTSTFIRIRFAASIPQEAAVDVYYRTAVVGATTPLTGISWVQVDPDRPIVYSQTGSDKFIDMSFSTGDIAAFGAMQVKLVMRSPNTAAIPLIKDLRVIACA